MNGEWRQMENPGGGSVPALRKESKAILPSASLWDVLGQVQVHIPPPIRVKMKLGKQDR